MAKSVDGDITLNVGINTSDVRQDINKVSKSVQSIFSKYSRDSKNANSSLLSLQHRMKEVVEQLQNIRKRQKDIAGNELYSNEYIEMAKDIQLAEEHLESLQRYMEKTKEIQDSLAESTISKEYNNLNQELATAQLELDKIIAKKEYIDRHLSGESGSKFNLVDKEAYLSMDPKFKPYKDYVNSLFGKKFWAEDYVELLNSVQKAEDALNDLVEAKNKFNASDVNIHSDKYNELEAQLQNAQQDYDNTINKVKQLTSVINSQEFKDNNVGIDTEAYDEAERKAVNLENRLGQLSAKYKEVSAKSSSSGGIMSRVFNKIKESASKIDFSNMANKAKDAFSKIANGTKKVIGGIAKMGSKIKESISKAKDSASMSFSKILKAGIGLLSLKAVFDLIKRSLSDAFNNMAQSVPQVQNELNSLKSAFGQVKNSLATAFQPIFSACVPALLTLANVLTNVANSVANFMATLTGQSYIYKATKANTGLANSVSGVGSAAKEAKKELAAYDDLIVINQDNASDGGSGGGGGAGSGGGFEKVAAEQSTLADKIKEAWTNSDFTEVGTIIGTKLKDSLDKVNWNNITSGARNAGKSLATLVNGFVGVPGLAKSLGSTVGNAFNTITAALNGFVTNVDWVSLGKFAGDFISSALFTFDWSSAAITLTTAIGGIATAISTASQTVRDNMPDFMPKIIQGIQDFITTFPTEEVAQAVGDVIGTITSFVTQLLPSVGDLVTLAGELVFTTIEKIPWSDLGTMLYTLITTAIQSASDLLTVENIQVIFNAIGDLLSSLKIPDLVDKLLTLATDIIHNLAQALLTIDWQEVGTQIGEALTKIGEHIPDIVGCLANLAMSILAGLAEAIKGLVSQPVGLAVGTAIVGVIIAAKKIGALAEAAGGLGTLLLNGMSSAISKGANLLSTALEGLGPKVMPMLQNAWSAAGPIAAVVAAGVAGWKIGEWLDSQFGKYTDEWFQNTFGDPYAEMCEATKALDFGSLVYDEVQRPYMEARQEIKQMGLDNDEAFKISAAALEQQKAKLDEYLKSATDLTEEEKEAKRVEFERWSTTQEETLKAQYGIEDYDAAIKDLDTSATLAGANLQALNDGVADEADNATTEIDEETTAIEGVDQASQNTDINFNDDVSTEADTAAESIGKEDQAIKDLDATDNVTDITYNEGVSEEVDAVTTDIGEQDQALKDLQTTNDGLDLNYNEGLPESIDEANTKIGEQDTLLSDVGTTSTDTSTNIDETATSVTELATALDSISSDKIADANDKTTTFKDKIDKAKTSTGKLKQKVDDAFKDIKKTIGDAASSVSTDWLKSMDDMLSDTEKKVSDKGTTMGTTITDKLRDAFKDNDSKVKNQAKTLADDIKKKFVDAMETGNNSAKTKIQTALKNALTDSDGSIKAKAKTLSENSMVTPIINAINAPTTGVADKLKSALETAFTTVTGNTKLQGIFKTFGQDYIAKPLSEAWGDFTSVVGSPITTNISDGSLQTAIGDLGAKAESSIRLAFNHIIGLPGTTNTLNNTLYKLMNAINSLIDTLNTRWHTNFSKYNFGNLQIPFMATGGVIPPNKEFLAVLGDQKQGVNIETPLDTMVQAFKAALNEDGNRGNNQPIMLTLDGKVIAQAVWDQNLKRYKQTGNYGFI